ncbi:unnamed protein product, partial [Allacma fusca]
MEGEFSGLRRSQRLLGIPPENCTTTLPGQRREYGTLGNSATGIDSLIQFSENVSVATVMSHRRSNRSVCSSQSEATRMKLKAEIESLQRIGKAEDEFLLLAKQRLETAKKIEEKRLEMEKIQIDDVLDEEENDYVHVPNIPEILPPQKKENIENWILNGNEAHHGQNAHSSQNDVMNQ